MVSAVFALCGVVIGQLLGFLSDRINHRRRVAARRNDDLLALSSQFLVDTDEVWSGRRKLAEAIIELQSDRNSSHGWETRAEAFRQMSTPRKNAKIFIMQMHIMTPNLKESAENLLMTSDVFKYEKYDEHVSARANALKHFLDAVRRETQK